MLVWTSFIIFILLCLILDLKVFNKEDHVISTKEAGKLTAFWVSLALLFSGVIWWLFKEGLVNNHTNLTPGAAVLDYITGYLMELSLSIDNVFVIAIIFNSFKIPPEYRHRVLYWGILGAIIFRAVMIVFGVALITKFEWMIFVFGAFLLISAAGMLKKDSDKDPHDTWFYRLVSKILPITSEIHGHDFILKKDHKTYATPLLVALVIIEFTDILFALDSIPAILAITQDEFIVFSSNILAILGLRSMFFLIIGALEKFHYIKYSLAVILAFVGVKMLIAEIYHIPSLASLAVIILALLGGVLFSKWKASK
ncbi:MAG: TerC family protein [Brumimicrobium sp.]|nr:TerC family protein [Brumimicrobium sp.]